MVLNFEFATNPTAANRNALNAGLHTWWTTQLKAILAQQLSLMSITSVNLDSPSAPSSVLTIGGGEPATSAGPSVPSNCALVVTHRTALRGRSYRGRTYVPSIDRASTSGVDFITAPVLALISSAFTWLMTPANVGNFIWSVLSKRNANTDRPLGVLTPIVGVTMDAVLDSQRRRLPGRGA